MKSVASQVKLNAKSAKPYPAVFLINAGLGAVPHTWDPSTWEAEAGKRQV